MKLARLTDPYASYGTDVPCTIPGSKQYWKSFGLDLVAITQQLGIPDFFLTLSPNDNWPHIQSIEPDDKMAVGPHPLESVLGAEKRFSKQGWSIGSCKRLCCKIRVSKEGRNPLAYIVLG